MKLALDITIRNLKQTTRDKGQMFMVIGFPVILILFFAFIFSGSTITGEEVTHKVGILNNDVIDHQWEPYFSPGTVNISNTVFDTGFGDLFTKCLLNESNFCKVEVNIEIIYFDSASELQEAVQSRTITLGLVIPEDFSQTILSGINNSFSLIHSSPILTNSSFQNTNSTIAIYGDSSLQSFQTVTRNINQALTEYTDHLYGLNELEIGGVFKTETSNLVSYELTNFDYFITGIIVFGIILGSSTIAYVAGNERALGTMDRLRISRTRPIEYLLGLSFAQVIFLTTTITVMLVMSYLIGFHGRGNPLYALFIGILCIPPVIGLGLLVSAIDKTGENASGIMSIISAPIGFLSGAFIPLPNIILIDNIIPDGAGGLKALELWDLNPLKLGVEATRLILLNERDLLQVLPEIVLMLISGIVLFLIGAIFFAKRVFTSIE